MANESDLKQRREIVAGGSSVYIDQPAVTAAITGRILIIEGLEKAERNVYVFVVLDLINLTLKFLVLFNSLPVVNNLLVNREMALEDGRFLIAAKR